MLAKKKNKKMEAEKAEEEKKLRIEDLNAKLPAESKRQLLSKSSLQQLLVSLEYLREKTRSKQC